MEKSGIIKTAALATTILGGLAIAAPNALAQETPPPSEGGASGTRLFLFSPVGPGQGNGVIGMGGKVFLFLPTYDLHYVRGLLDQLDLYFDLNTLVVINAVDLGLRVRAVGDADAGFALGIKAGVSPLFAFLSLGDAGTAGAVSFAATPGLVVSFGGRSTQFTLGFDLPIYFGSAGFVAGGEASSTGTSSDITLVGRPAASIEWLVGSTTNMYIQASGLISFASVGGFFGPIVAIGAAW
ncbi:MAG: hypothetical protein HYV07_24290 [Deltaproteobacteria bacterium]|nr:hypothetical protein [Deltaproteobacteria bacterium]